MKLEIILPPAPRACDRNHGKAGIAAAGSNKRARLIAKVRALEAMRAQGVPRTFKPRVMELYVFDRTGRMDLDNAVATFKRYQDGIFDALDCDDRAVEVMHALRVSVRKVKHGDWRPLHRWTRCVLSDGPMCMFMADCGRLEDILEEAEKLKGAEQ